MGSGSRRALRIGGAALGLALLAALSLCLGRYRLNVGDVARALAHPGGDARVAGIVWQIRLPRILLACLVGAALSLSGTALQSVFHNPMASPDLLGASSGACFGAALALLAGLSRPVVALFAFVTSLLAVGLSALLAGRMRRGRTEALILTGIVVGSLFSGGTSCVKLLADPDNRLPGITYWMMGSLSGATGRETLLAAVPIGLAALVLALLRYRMNALGLSDDEAAGMGVNIRALRWVTIACAALLTAASVAVSGLVNWVGLLIPNLCRRVWGGDLRRLVPASMLAGAAFLLAMDDLARTLTTAEIPIGILTSFVGAPLFLAILLRREKRGE